MEVIKISEYEIIRLSSFEIGSHLYVYLIVNDDVFDAE